MVSKMTGETSSIIICLNLAQINEEFMTCSVTDLISHYVEYLQDLPSENQSKPNSG